MNHDLFISYAHLDNLPLLEGQKGWITQFHSALSVRLSQLLGREPKIWRDHKLQGNDFFDKVIINQFPTVAALVVIVTPRYVQSEWCMRECQTFIEQYENTLGITAQEKSRIFKIVKTPVPLEEQPNHFHNLLGYEFFTMDREVGRIREFNSFLGQEYQQLYWIKLDDLAHDLCNLLKELESKPETPAPKAPTATESTPTIYLADTCLDMQLKRDTIRREMVQYGYLVKPDQPLNVISNSLESDIKQQMTQCDLSIHMIGDTYGAVPEGTEKSIIQMQYEVATTLSQQQGMQRLLWLDTTKDCQDKRQVQFLDLIHNNCAIQQGAEVLTDSIEDLKNIIHVKLSRDQKESPNSTLDEHRSSVYLIHDQSDYNAVAPIGDCLFNNNYEVILPVFEGDESSIREDHLENLKTCEAVIIYYGKSSELWVRAKFRELIKIAGYGRTSQFKAKGLYIGGERTNRKEQYRTHDAIVMKGFDSFEENHLQPFLSQLS